MDGIHRFKTTVAILYEDDGPAAIGGQSAAPSHRKLYLLGPGSRSHVKEFADELLLNASRKNPRVTLVDCSEDCGEGIYQVMPEHFERASVPTTEDPEK